MSQTLYERLGCVSGITQLGDDVQNDVLSILYSMKGEIIRV